MAPRSLVEMCLKVATDNISRITGLGSLPPHLVVPILKHVKTANQLRKFELNSDDIYEETAEPWKRIIKQDFPLLVPIHNFVPEDERCWHEVWQRYKDLQDQAEAEAIEALKSQQDLARKQHESRRATIISAKESNKLSRTKHRSGPFQPKANTQHPFLRKTRGDLKLWAKQVGVARTMNGGPLNVLAPGVKRPASSVFPARPDAVDRKRLKTEREAGRPAKNGGTDDVDPEQDDDDDLFGDREFAASLKLTATSPTATSPTATSPTATSPTATSPTATSPSSCSINKTASTRRPPPKQTTQPKQPHRAALLVAKAPPNVRVIGRSASPTRLGLKGNWVL